MNIRTLLLTTANAISTAVNQVGSNATFIDMGGSATDSNLLTGVLGDLPELLKKLDVKNQALNGESFSETLNATIRAVTDKQPHAETELNSSESDQPKNQVATNHSSDTADVTES